jgi:hypothetical protein
VLHHRGCSWSFLATLVLHIWPKQAVRLIPGDLRCFTGDGVGAGSSVEFEDPCHSAAMIPLDGDPGDVFPSGLVGLLSGMDDIPKLISTSLFGPLGAFYKNKRVGYILSFC